jgi:hypothetical protein
MFKIIDISITDDTNEPITLSDAKAHCRITSEDFDSILTDLITVARQKLERFTSRSLVSKDIVLTVETNEAIPLPYPVLDDITSVKLLQGQNSDGTNDWQTLTASDYQILGSEIATFYPPHHGVHEITYSTTANTDKSILYDLKRVLLWLFENAGDDSDNMPEELMSNAKHKRILSWV